MWAAAPFELLAVGVKRDLQSVSESEVAEVTQRIESSLTRTSAHVTEIAEMSPARVQRRSFRRKKNRVFNDNLVHSNCGEQLSHKRECRSA